VYHHTQPCIQVLQNHLCIHWSWGEHIILII
jgi:hypothetical protein